MVVDFKGSRKKQTFPPKNSQTSKTNNFIFQPLIFIEFSGYFVSSGGG